MQGFESQLAQYEMIKNLGCGISSYVMMARHRVSNEKFAIKVVSASFMS